MSMENQLLNSNLTFLAAVIGWLFWMEYSHRIDIRAPEEFRSTATTTAAANPVDDQRAHFSNFPIPSEIASGP
jgi:hypothetical protein